MSTLGIYISRMRQTFLYFNSCFYSKHTTLIGVSLWINIFYYDFRSVLYFLRLTDAYAFWLNTIYCVFQGSSWNLHTSLCFPETFCFTGDWCLCFWILYDLLWFPRLILESVHFTVLGEWVILLHVSMTHTPLDWTRFIVVSGA